MKRTNTAKWIESAQRWQINVQKDGVRKTFTSAKPGRTGQREANKKADDWLDKGIKTGRVKVADAWEEFLQARKAVSENEYKSAECFGRVHILPIIGSKTLTSVTEQDYQSILDKAFRNPAKANKQTLSRKTLRNLKVTISQFVKFCRKSNLATLELYDLKIPESARYVGKSIVDVSAFKKVFEDDEITVHNKKQKDEYINYYRFQLLTGVRPGELRGLKWENISGNICKIDGAVNNDGEHTKGKNENAIRAIVLSDFAMKVLDDQRKVTGKEKYIFPMPTMRAYYRRWGVYQAQHGIPHTSLYEMRHTFVSAAKTLPAGQLKQLVGHSEDMDTYGTYSHVLANDAEETAKNLDAVFGKIINL